MISSKFIDVTQKEIMCSILMTLFRCYNILFRYLYFWHFNSTRENDERQCNYFIIHAWDL